MKKQTQVIFLVVLGVTSCTTTRIASDDAFTPGQMNEMSDLLDRKHVKAKGWIRVDFEKYSLWESEEANFHKSFDKCISVMFPVAWDRKKYDRKYVEVEGLFFRRLPPDVVHLGGCNSMTLKLDQETLPVLIQKP